MNDLLTIGVYRIQSGSYAAQISNLPPDYGPKAGVCAVIHTLQLLASYGDTSSTFSALWIRDNYMSGSERRWTEWVKVAGRTSPQEFDLALYDGFTVNGRCFYYKTQESVVHVIGGVDGSFPYKLSAVIGQLPVGFRPSAATRGIAVTNNAPAYIQINTNGAVVLYEMGLDGTPTGTSAFFALSFVAGS